MPPDLPTTGSHRIIIPSAVNLTAALPADLVDLDATQIALCFDLMESDINFDGLAVSTDWLDPAQGAGTSDSLRLAQMVDDAINRTYPEGDLATLRIEGLVLSRDAVRWLRALRLRSHYRTSALTRLALIKA